MTGRIRSAGGDDYELCFTAPPHRGPELAALAAELGLALTEVGEITDARGLDLVDRAGAPWSPGSGGYRHF